MQSAGATMARRNQARRVVGGLVALAVLGLGAPALARPPLPPPPAVAWPGADHDPAIPTVKQVLGFEPGTEMARHAEVRRYFEALAAAAPARMKLVDYGVSYEGRSLFHGVISSERNIARLDEIRAKMQRLADPRRLAPGEAERLIAELPAIVWLSYAIHGDEPGPTDAALATAYHLLSARGDARVPKMLDETVIVIAPLLNPDGRERFINSNRAVRGVEPDPSPLSAEREQPWPGGRMNHYVFDLNRDWYSQTQIESQGHSGLLLSWMPVVVADVHEMGGNMTFFFPPAADPTNPNLTATQRANVELIGRNNAAWFDRFGLRYFTREIFDEFFPGYGSGWPLYLGAAAMVYEQGSSRGLAFARADGTLLPYADTVMSQYVAALSAVEVAAVNREKFLRDFHAYRASAIEEGRREPVKAYVVSAAPDPDLAARLGQTLARNGIEVTRASGAFQACGGSFPAGSLVVSAAQPTKRLIRTLMDEKTVMDPAFVARQDARTAKGLPDEIYDVTAWSLPLVFNAPTTTCASVPAVQGEAITRDWRPQGSLSNPQATVAFLSPWGSTATARFLAAALRAGVNVKSSNAAFTLNGVRYPPGSLIMPVAGSRDLAATLKDLAQRTGAQVTGVDTSWTSEGPNMGSPQVVHMPAPRIALAWDDPTEGYSAGHTRFLLEREFGYPVTLIRAGRLAGANLDGFDVIIMPGEGRSYAAALGRRGADNLRAWVSRGGVLIGVGTATRWMANAEVDMLPIRLEDSALAPKPEERPGAAASDGRAPGTMIATEEERAKAMAAQRVPPRPIPGALARARPDPDHWLAAGLPPTLNVLVNGSDIYTPARLNEADTVVRFEGPDRLLASGVLWEESRRQLAFKPFVVSRRLGSGLAIGFTQDPNFRAHLPGLNLAFLNAVFRGAAMTHDATTAGVQADEER